MPQSNHIASEQKRRQAIREGFDKITSVVPDLTKSQGRSEGIVLQKSKFSIFIYSVAMTL